LIESRFSDISKAKDSEPQDFARLVGGAEWAFDASGTMNISHDPDNPLDLIL
jgi:hypothetical protein